MYEEHTHKAFPQVPVDICNGNLGFRNVSQQFCTVLSVTPETIELFCLNGLSLKNTSELLSCSKYKTVCLLVYSTVKDMTLLWSII